MGHMIWVRWLYNTYDSYAMNHTLWLRHGLYLGSIWWEMDLLGIHSRIMKTSFLG